MTNKWNLRVPTTEEIQKRDQLAKELDLSPVIALLLVQRGITSAEEVKKFFRPSLNDLHDPFLMPDMDKAVARLNKALGNKEKILIYGDYDVDGTTAVSLVYKYLRLYSTALDYYIPDRYDEGYGISYKGIDYAAERGITLVISLDCGIKAIEKIEYAKQKGIDFIICDHHMPDDVLPDAVAVLDAKRTDSIYPYEHLSGCGVGFKFMQAFAISNNFPFSDLEKLLELTAVSIASDIVPITGENRILAYYGLRQINNNPSLGLKGIIDVCGLSTKDITISDIVFKIGPRINASGRMMNGKEAVELLLAKSVEIAKEKSESINQYNEERRELDKKITDEANAIINLMGAVGGMITLVLIQVLVPGHTERPNYFPLFAAVAFIMVVSVVLLVFTIPENCSGVSATGSSKPPSCFDRHMCFSTAHAPQTHAAAGTRTGSSEWSLTPQGRRVFSCRNSRVLRL